MTMKALQLERPAGEVKKGQRNVVAVRDVPMPSTQRGLVLVKIAAAGFNRRDEWSALGLYPGLLYENSTLGCDASGIVVDPETLQPSAEATLQILVPSRGWEKDPCGPEPDLGENEFGGRGFALLGATKGVKGAGLFAEYIAVHRDQLVPAPPHLDASQCATLPCASTTAYRALFTKGQVAAGHNVLITGIGGGVALLALQLAVAAGARVFVTGGSQEKLDRALQMGAAGGALYRETGWPSKVKSMLPSDRPWLDCTIDSAGGDICAQSVQAGLRSGGKVVVFGMTAGANVPFAMREVMLNVELLGTTLGSAREFRESIDFIAKHKIQPVIDTVLPDLDHATDAFELLRDSDKRSGGKVVVQVSGESQQPAGQSKV